MSIDRLEFEEPVNLVIEEMEALLKLPQTPQRQEEIKQLRFKAESLRAEIYSSLGPWQRVLVARHLQPFKNY